MPLYSQNPIFQQAASWTLGQWQIEPAKLLPNEIEEVITLASQEFDSVAWKDKLEALISCLSDYSQLESTGKALTRSQISILLDSILISKPSLREKLPPIFVGMRQDVFRNLLFHASQKQLSLLQQEATIEPIRHHLTLLTRELANEIDSFSNRLKAQADEIAQSPVEQFGRSEIAKITAAIESLQFEGEEKLHEISQAVALVWHTNRTDLIDRLSQVKEHCQKNISYYLQPKEKPEKESTSLWKLLENRLNAVLADPNNILYEDEPVIEALVKFSIWYIKDYQEIGLLPGIETAEQLELALNHASEQERIHYREKLFQAAERNLHCLGLFTLADLQRNQIYSKKALCDFIDEHRSKLLNFFD